MMLCVRIAARGLQARGCAAAATTREQALEQQKQVRKSMWRNKVPSVRLAELLGPDFEHFKHGWLECVQDKKPLPQMSEIIAVHRKQRYAQHFKAEELREFMKDQQEAGDYTPALPDLIALIPYYESFDKAFESFEEAIGYAKTLQPGRNKLSVAQECLMEDAGTAIMRTIHKRITVEGIEGAVSQVMARLAQEGSKPTAMQWGIALGTLRKAGAKFGEMDGMWMAMEKSGVAANPWHYAQYIKSCNARMRELVWQTDTDEVERKKAINDELDRAERKFDAALNTRAGDMSDVAPIVMTMLRYAEQKNFLPPPGADGNENVTRAPHRIERFLDVVNKHPLSVPDVAPLANARINYSNGHKRRS